LATLTTHHQQFVDPPFLTWDLDLDFEQVGGGSPSEIGESSFIQIFQHSKSKGLQKIYLVNLWKVEACSLILIQSPPNRDVGFFGFFDFRLQRRRLFLQEKYQTELQEFDLDHGEPVPWFEAVEGRDFGQ